MKLSLRFLLVAVATLHAPILAALLMGCSSSPIRLQGGVEGDATYGSTGATTRLSIAAGKDGSNLSIALVSLPSAIVVSPTTVTTDDDGNATAFVLVPYGIQGVIVVSAQAATAASIPVGCDPISLCGLLVQPETGEGNLGPTGQVCSVSVQAFRTGPCGSGSPLTVEGLNVAFTTTTTGVTFSPAAVVTNSSGVATSNVIIPYGTQVQAVVSGGGAVSMTTGTAPSVTLTAGQLTPTETFLPSGEVYTLTATATVGAEASPLTVEGLNVAFTTTTTGVTFSPAAVVTNSSGVATSNVIIPYGTQVQAVVSGGGAVSMTTGTAPSVTLTSALASPADPSSPCTQSNPCEITVTALVGEVPLQGLGISIVITDVETASAGGAGISASSDIAGPVSPILTNASGSVKYDFSIPPNVVAFWAVASGGGTSNSTPYSSP